MSHPSREREPIDPMAALERLYAKKVITLEEGQAAARLITGDESTPFPAPKPSPPAQAPDAAPAPAPASAPQGDEAAPTERPPE